MSGAVAVLARHGRSFRWAGALLSGAQLQDAAELYAFCRAVDDLADEAGDTPAAREAAAGRLSRLRAALDDPSSEDPLAAALRTLAARTGLDPAPAKALVETVASDLGAVRLPDKAALLDYAGGVAGTVGLMMRDLLGARDRARAGPHARDLGIAMQLTNVSRDVEEDARRGRLYLPATWLPAGVAPDDLLRPGPARAAAWEAVVSLLRSADPYYRSAERGLAWLPPRPRLAVLVAARLYEAIGARILRAGPEHYWGRRAAVPPLAKAALTASALVTLLRRRVRRRGVAPHAPLPGRTRA